MALILTEGSMFVRFMLPESLLAPGGRPNNQLTLVEQRSIPRMYSDGAHRPPVDYGNSFYPPP